MRIAILSDTHARAGDVPGLMDTLKPHLEGVHRILHAGDVTAPELLDALAQVAPLDAVAGNMDGPRIRARFPEKNLVQLGSKRFGLMHGWGSPGDLERKIWERFLDHQGRPHLDGIIFGHSHQPHEQIRQDVLMLNPGSATSGRGGSPATMMLMNIDPGVEIQVVPLT